MYTLPWSHPSYCSTLGGCLSQSVHEWWYAIPPFPVAHCTGPRSRCPQHSCQHQSPSSIPITWPTSHVTVTSAAYWRCCPKFVSTRQHGKESSLRSPNSFTTNPFEQHLNQRAHQTFCHNGWRHEFQLTSLLTTARTGPSIEARRRGSDFSSAGNHQNSATIVMGIEHSLYWMRLYFQRHPSAPDRTVGKFPAAGGARRKTADLSVGKGTAYVRSNSENGFFNLLAVIIFEAHRVVT